jgi:hypothetical protein
MMLAVLRGNEVVKLALYGRANLELDVPASSSTAFPGGRADEPDGRGSVRAGRWRGEGVPGR